MDISIVIPTMKRKENGFNYLLSSLKNNTLFFKTSIYKKQIYVNR